MGPLFRTKLDGKTSVTGEDCNASPSTYFPFKSATAPCGSLVFVLVAANVQGHGKFAMSAAKCDNKCGEVTAEPPQAVST